MGYRSKEQERAYKKRYYETVAKPSGKNKSNYEKHKVKRLETNRAKKLKTSKDPVALLHRRWVRSLSTSERFLWDLWKQFQFTSKQRDIEFLLTYDELCKLYLDQNQLCIYTKLPLELSKNNRMTISIDRVDSSKGYSLENCVLCGAIINLMKLDLTIEEFKYFCGKVR